MKTLQEFIYFDENDYLSKLSKKEITQFLKLLDHYYLEYRKLINIPSKYTFGLEIEAEYMEGSFFQEISSLYLKGWRQASDFSLENGDEYISPILSDTSNAWTDLKKICDILNKHYQIKDTCGGHIHIGTHILGPNEQSYQNFIKLWSTYENIIYRFSYGEFLNPRFNINICAKPVSNRLFDIIKNKEDYSDHYMSLINACNLFKSCGISFYNVKNKQKGKNNTIEIRCPNGSLEPIIWQNNINFFMKLFLYSKSCDFDNDKIEKRRCMNQGKYSLSFYNQIYLEQALELVDLIFHSNLDKIYFLRQYLKSFEVSDKRETLQKAKIFIKK